MGFIQSLGSQFANRLMGRLMPTGEEEYEQYQSQLAKAKAEAEMKGLQRLDEPIYQQQDPWNIGPQVRDGERYAPYKSPITWGMVKDLNLQPEELPRRDIEALGLRPSVRREPRPQYDIFETPEGYEYLPKGSEIPPDYKPYNRMGNLFNPFAVRPQETQRRPQEEMPGTTLESLPGQLKPLDKETAAAILEEAGGNKSKAREIARKRGYRF